MKVPITHVRYYIITKLVLVLSMRNITIMDSRQVVMNILKLRLISSLNVNFPAEIFSDDENVDT